MSSLYKTSGHYRVSFQDHTTRKRPRINTRMSDKSAAREIQRKIDDLIDRKAAHKLPDDALARWIETCPDALRKQLVTAGLVDDRHRRLDELVQSFKQSLMDKGNTAEHVEKTTNRLQTVLNGCKVAALADLTPGAVQRWLAEQRETNDKKIDGIKQRFSRATSNYYLRAVKQFTRWLIRERVVSVDPLAGLQAINARIDKKQRMALSADDLAALIQSTTHGPERYGMSGTERAILYRLAVETGLRASELRSLTAGSFDLNSESPMVRIEAAHTKNRREDTLPLRADTAALLTTHLMHKAPVARAFALPRRDDMANMIRADAADAGVATVDDAERRLDFHSLRHTCGTLLAAGNVHPKLIQRIMRHSTITLTMDRYTHAFKADEAEALEKLPTLEVMPMQATGTDDVPAGIVTAQREQKRERAGGFSGHSTALSGAKDHKGLGVSGEDNNGDMHDLALCGAESENADGWTRTTDLGLMNPSDVVDSQGLTTQREQKQERAEVKAASPTPTGDADLDRLAVAWPTLPAAIRRAILAMIDA